MKKGMLLLLLAACCGSEPRGEMVVFDAQEEEAECARTCEERYGWHEYEYEYYPDGESVCACVNPHYEKKEG